MLGRPGSTGSSFTFSDRDPQDPKDVPHPVPHGVVMLDEEELGTVVSVGWSKREGFAKYGDSVISCFIASYFDLRWMIALSFSASSHARAPQSNANDFPEPVCPNEKTSKHEEIRCN